MSKKDIKDSKFIIRKLIKVIFVLIIPFFIGMNLFPLINKCIIVNDQKISKDYSFPEIDVHKRFKHHLFSELIEVPLNLKWYDICLTNKSYVKMAENNLS